MNEKAEEAMRWYDPLLFLIGNRAAILRIGSSWWALLVGALLVVTAGIARNYDHHSMLYEWKWCYGPFLASIASSILVGWFGCMSIVFDRKNRHAYVSFMVFYWMTAPCAWLYGIPVESYVDLLTATKWNIGFLVIVALWRVVLMIRVLTIYTGEGWMISVGRILWPASLITVFASLPLIPIMGGINLPPDREIIVNAARFTSSNAFIIFLGSLLLLLVGHTTKKKSEKKSLPWRKVKMPKGALLFAVSSIAVWLAASIPFQHKVTRNYKLSQFVHKEDYQGAIAYASALERDDFSAIHYLAPDPHRGWSSFDKLNRLLKALPEDAPSWLRKHWQDSLEEAKRWNPWRYKQYMRNLERQNDDSEGNTE